MKKILTALTLAASVMLSTQVSAVIIDASTVIPTENILLNVNGLDWVYAGPIATESFGPGNIETPEYRAGEGWRYASAEEWELRPDWTDFIIGSGTLDPVSGFGDHSLYRFASEYWSDYSTVDLSDAADGFLTNGYDIDWIYNYETWYVRDAVTSDVPESSSIMLLSLGLLGLAFARRKQSK